MTPIEAWHIISANMKNYYRHRAADAATAGKPYCGYDSADIEAEVICYQALSGKATVSNCEWITLGNKHFRLDSIIAFCRSNDGCELAIDYGSPVDCGWCIRLEDLDGAYYLALCKALGVEPIKKEGKQ